MKPLTVGLMALVAVLAITVAYGYGCGGDDDEGGSGDTTTAVEADGTSSSAASTESSDGGGTPDDGRNGGGDGGDGGADGDGGKDGDGAPASKASYVKQADAICGKVPTRYGQNLAALEKGSKGKKLPTAEANLKAAVPPLYTAIEELEGLSPPSGDEKQVEAIIDALEAAAKGLEAKPSSELTGPKSPFADFQKLSKEYGLKVCSRL